MPRSKAQKKFKEGDQIISTKKKRSLGVGRGMKLDRIRMHSGVGPKREGILWSSS